MDWYYVQDNQRCGPVADPELVRLADTGTVSAATYVWHTGLPAWTQLGPLVATPTGLPLRTCDGCGLVRSEPRLLPLLDQWLCVGCKPMALQRLLENGYEVQTRYASWGIRFLAIFVDGFIMGVVTQVIALLSGTLLGAAAAGAGLSGTGAEFAAFGLALVVGTILRAVYDAVFVASYGATPGKLMCRLRIVRADGSKVGWGLAWGRHFAKWLSYGTCFIGFLMPLWDREQRALHDHLCGTRVIRL